MAGDQMDGVDRDPLSGRSIAIAGGGLIGASWGALFTHYGARVRLWDPDHVAREVAAHRFETAMGQLAEVCRPKPGGTFSIAAGLNGALEGAELVQENAPESIAIKQELYRDIEGAVPETTIVASSTSALTWSDLAPGLRVPERFVTAHPFNPPHLIPLVELYGIDSSVLDRAEAMYRAADRVPVRLRKDATGHIANRLSSALWREAVHIVADGIADVAAVDMALVNGPGLRWSVIGAHMAYHLGGGDGGLASYLQHLGPSQERRWSDLGSPQLDDATKAALIEGVNVEADGRDLATLAAGRDEALIRQLRSRREVETEGSRAAAKGNHAPPTRGSP
jgi:carnitine 3-dehydrogenase